MITKDKLISKYYPDCLYKDGDDVLFNSAYSYQPMITAIADANVGKVSIQVDDQDYQGDTRILLTRPAREDIEYGILIFGWGSCSGCDALQACSSVDEMYALFEKLTQSIQWRSKQDMAEYLKTHDWEGDFSNGELTRKFVNACIAIVS